MSLPACTDEIKRYLESMDTSFQKLYSVARAARKKGYDPALDVEISPAQDVAARVEGLVGPENVAARIRELLATCKTREECVVKISQEIIEGKFTAKSLAGATEDREVKVEQAIRTGLALYTEGVVSAPLEGFTKIKIRKNEDGSEYLALFFSGPIRGAGGTGQAFTVLLGDYVRTLVGLAPYAPSADELNRYVEEMNLYARKTRSGQYVPTEDEVRHITKSCPVTIDGEPTEEYEVEVNKNLPNIEGNRVRGGMVLVYSEGICLKAAKIYKISKQFPNVDWKWTQALVKTAKQDANAKYELKPVTKYLQDIVAGRPIFSYPMTAGGFALRYGRTRLSGIASKAIHPATMILFDDFPAIGTQIKLERPGKGCIVVPCETIDGPIVKFKNGTVERVSTDVRAKEIAADKNNPGVEILFNGDMLVNYGDFAKANHPLVPSSWCDEWYCQELLAVNISKTKEECAALTFNDALELTKNAPLAPKFTFYYHDLTLPQLKELAQYLTTGKFAGEEFILDVAPAKRILEINGVEHQVRINEATEKIYLRKDDALALLYTLGLTTNSISYNLDKFNSLYDETKNVMTFVNELAGFKVMNRVGVYIGTSMGRPEKSKERKMQPPVHSLFPIGAWGGKMRSVVKAVANLKHRGEHNIQVDVAIRMCPGCKVKTPMQMCIVCGKKTIFAKQCEKCAMLCISDKCPKCNSRVKLHEQQPFDLIKAFENATKATDYRPQEVKGVIGLISANKAAEPLEKGILRAKHDVYVFRDGTCRVDATEVPKPHSVPKEIGLSIDGAKKLGYSHDKDGKPLVDENQTVELYPQDIIISKYALEYLFRAAKFVDDELVYIYGLPPHYNVKEPKDMHGQLTICIAPHISAGISSRIIGSTEVRGLLAHPYLHCACRRNCDSDELCFMLLLDGLINFSKEYLPTSRGGKMDAPLVLSSILNPQEVDDEVHAMDCCKQYPLDFYRGSLNNLPTTDVKVETVNSRLGKPLQYEQINYTHESSIQGPTSTAYIKMKNMTQKVDMELELMTKIRSVDQANAAEKTILSHFFPDLYGNLRSFGRQIFRCVECNQKYRRVPLKGKCRKCGGKLLLTISKGGIEKYLKVSYELADKYNLPLYLKQRLQLIEKDIKSMFEDDKSKQFSLSNYL